MKDKKVNIIMGSDSDLPVMQDAVRVLEEFGIKVNTQIISAHRNIEGLTSFINKANEEADGQVLYIAGAGGAAHLPGVIAALTTAPVIGVPIMTKSMSGLDSLLSIVQMPSGVPVATVAINGAKNAGLLAIQIMALSDEELRKKISEYKHKMKETVEKKSQELQVSGIQEYLEKNKK